MSAGPRRPPKDRDFVETAEGFFFCLVGYLHPPDRYTAYLKYTPAESGRPLCQLSLILAASVED